MKIDYYKNREFINGRIFIGTKIRLKTYSSFGQNRDLLLPPSRLKEKEAVIQSRIYHTNIFFSLHFRMYVIFLSHFLSTSVRTFILFSFLSSFIHALPNFFFSFLLTFIPANPFIFVLPHFLSTFIHASP